MVKQAQTISRLLRTNWLSVFANFVEFARKGLNPLLFIIVLKALSREVRLGYREELLLC